MAAGTAESWKHHNQDLIIKLKGVDDRDAANLLTNCEIVVDSSQLPALEEETITERPDGLPGSHR